MAIGSLSSVPPLRYTPAAAVPPAPPATVSATPTAAAPQGGSFHIFDTNNQSMGRILSWIGGGFGAFKISEALGFNPAGWALAGVCAAGAWVGDKLFNTLSGQSGGLSADGTTKYIAMGGGAFGALKIAKAMNMNPAGWGLAAVLGIGAVVGDKLYHTLTGR